MANVVRDPTQVHPCRSRPTFTKPDPAGDVQLEVTISPSSMRGQVEAALFPRKRATTTFRWAHSGTSPIRFGAPYLRSAKHRLVAGTLSADNMQRPTGPLCDGCHSVNYNIQSKTVTEWNVGCETLSRPGRRTCAANRRTTNIVIPARLDYHCRRPTPVFSLHSQGQPLTNPIQPANTTTGRSAFIGRDGLEATSGNSKSTRLGEQTFMHYADGTGAQESHAGERFRAERDMYTDAVNCLFQPATMCTAPGTTPIC